VPSRRLGWAWVSGVVALTVATAAEPRLAALVVAAAITITVWFRPGASLKVLSFAVLAIRPSLDIFSERRLGLGPFAANPDVILGLLILLVAMVLAIRRARDGQPVWPDRQLWHAHMWLLIAYGFAFAAGWRWYGTYGGAVGVREAIRMASVIAAFLVVLWWVNESRDKNRAGWRYLLLGTGAPIAVAVWQFVTGRGNRDIEWLNRLQGTFAHPNTLGPYLVPFILLAIAGVRTADRRGRVLRIVAAAALSVLVALTYSRTAILVLVTGMLMIPVLQLRRLGWRALTGSASAALVFALLGWLLVGSMIRERFSDLRISSEAFQAARTGEAENSLEWRLMNWGVLVAVGLEHPLVGHGAGMTTELNPIVNSDTGLPYNAHNDFVRFFFEGGLLGLLAYLVYGVLLCRWALIAARLAEPRDAPGAYAVAAALFALFFLTAGTPEFGQQTAIQYEIYGMLALMTGVRQMDGATHSANDMTAAPRTETS